MRRIAMVAALAAALMVAGLPAGATVHEQVGAACGGLLLLPPGITGGSNVIADNFAKPVLSNGVVVFTGEGEAEIGDSPAAKFDEGTPVVVEGNPVDLGDVNHKSNNCKALR